MPQMKTIFWLDVLSLNSLSLYIQSYLFYIFFSFPPTSPANLMTTLSHPLTTTYNTNSWSWKW